MTDVNGDLMAAIEQSRLHAQRVIDNPNAHPAAEAMAVVMLVDLEAIVRAVPPEPPMPGDPGWDEYLCGRIDRRIEEMQAS